MWSMIQSQGMWLHVSFCNDNILTFCLKYIFVITTNHLILTCALIWIGKQLGVRWPEPAGHGKWACSVGAGDHRSETKMFWHTCVDFATCVLWYWHPITRQIWHVDMMVCCKCMRLSVVIQQQWDFQRKICAWIINRPVCVFLSMVWNDKQCMCPHWSMYCKPRVISCTSTEVCCLQAGKQCLKLLALPLAEFTLESE